VRWPLLPSRYEVRLMRRLALRPDTDTTQYPSPADLPPIPIPLVTLVPQERHLTHRMEAVKAKGAGAGPAPCLSLSGAMSTYSFRTLAYPHPYCPKADSEGLS